MPDYVFRHPKLKGQPVVRWVAVGASAPDDLRDAGWELDTSTTPAEAEAEVVETQAAAEEKAAKKAEKFVPTFAEPDPVVDTTVPNVAPTTEPKE